MPLHEREAPGHVLRVESHPWLIWLLGLHFLHVTSTAMMLLGLEVFPEAEA